MQEEVLCWLASVNLIQTRVPLEEATSAEEWPYQTGLWAHLWSIFLIANRCRRA